MLYYEFHFFHNIFFTFPAHFLRMLFTILQSTLSLLLFLLRHRGCAPSSLANGHGLVALLAQLSGRGVQLAAGKVADGQTLLDGPLLVAIDGDGEGEHDALGGAVGAIREHTHGSKSVTRKKIG